MTSKNQGGINPVTAAVAGAVVGAGVAVAGAMILKDKKNREKITKVLNNAKDQAVDYVEGIQKKAQEKKDKVQKVSMSVKKSLNQAVKDVKKAVK